MRVLRDSREKHGWEFDDMIIKCLKTGDYTLEGFEDKLTIERKASTSEFARNVVEPRFKRELERMQSYKWFYMIFEFSEYDLLHFPESSNIPKSRWNQLRVKPKFLFKKVAEYRDEYKCNIIFADKFGKAAAESIFHEVLSVS